MCSATSNDEIENIHLLNVLNWSPLESLNITKPSITSAETSVKDENDSKSRTDYNAVQISIELQKKMLL